MKSSLDTIISDFLKKNSEGVNAETLSQFLRHQHIDIERYGYNNIQEALNNNKSILYDSASGVFKYQTNDFSHLNLDKKPLEDYVGEVYWLENELLDIQNTFDENGKPIKHHLAVLAKLHVTLESSGRYFLVAKGTSKIHNPKFRHKVFIVWDTFEHPTGFFNDCIPFKANKLVKKFVKNKRLPCKTLKESDLNQIQKQCNLPCRSS
jgi:hypothetical protein